MDNRLRFANIPEAFRNMQLNTFTYDVYKSKESRERIVLACKIIKNYLENFEDYRIRGMGLYLFSETKGSGKTRMAASIANELIKRELTVKFAASTVILREIKATWYKNSKYTEGSLLDALSSTEILIIDDFGVEEHKDWIGEKFYQIVNDRYINRKTTIFTSNYSLDVIKYDDRIVNRIKEMTFQIAFPEESVRDKIANDNRKEILDKIIK